MSLIVVKKSEKKSEKGVGPTFGFYIYWPHSLAKQGNNAIGSVCLFVCLPVHLSMLSCLNCLTYNFNIRYVG